MATPTKDDLRRALRLACRLLLVHDPDQTVPYIGDWQEAYEELVRDQLDQLRAEVKSDTATPVAVAG